MPYPNEHACRLRDPEDLEIVGSSERKTDGKTYRVIYGKPKGGDGSVEQAYRYPVEGWSEAVARRHCEEHNGRFEPATKEAGLKLEYFAAVQAVEERDGRHYARIYLMDTSLNRNNWRVTSQALEKALNTLLGKPLTARPGYRVNHVSQPLNVGSFVQADKPNGYALGVAEITEQKAWKKLESKELGPVSVEITAHKVTCSQCGRDVLDEPCEHIRSGEGHEVVEDFSFNRVAFVREPAYPNAQVLVFDGLEQSRLQTRSALTASESPRGDGPKGAPNPENEKGEEKMAEEIEKLQSRIKEGEKKIAELEEQNKTLKTKLEEAQGKLAEKAGIEDQVKDLQAKLDKIEEERHLERVAELVDLRIQAGLTKERDAEIQKYKAFDEKTLNLLKGDVEVFITEKQRFSKLAGPKAKFTAEQQDQVKAKMEEIRMRYFGHKETPGTPTTPGAD